MTPQKRLDQIEPVIGEILAVLDQHTALHRQTQAQIKQLTVTFTQTFSQQSDQISFLLTDAAERKEQTTHIQHQVDFLSADAKAKDQRLDRLETDVSSLKTDMAGVKADVSSLKTDVSSLKADVSSLKTDVSSLKTDVSSLKTDVSSLKTDVSSLKTDVAEILSILRQR